MQGRTSMNTVALGCEEGGFAYLADTIADESYPLCNEFYAAVRQDSGPDTPERKVYDWLSTNAGRACIQKSGYVAAQ